MTESKLQSDCFREVHNTYPHLRGRFFLIYNNPKNKLHGAILKGMGMRRGVSDQILLPLSGGVTWIECKLPGEGQSPDQIEFQGLVESLGMRYYLYHSLSELMDIFRAEGELPPTSG